MVQEQRMNQEKIHKMAEMFEQATNEWEEKFSNKENEVNDRVRKKLMEQMAISSSVEQNLITELQERDDKIKVIEKTNKDLEKKLNQIQERSDREMRELQNKLIDLETKQNIQDEISRVENKYTRKITEIQKEHDNKLYEKESYISTIHSIREELMKKALALEADNKKLTENNNNLKKKIQELEQSKSQSEAKLNEEIHSLQEANEELKNTSLREQNRLMAELRKFASEGRGFEEEVETRATMNDGEDEPMLKPDSLSLELGGGLGGAFEYSEKATQRASIMFSPMNSRLSPLKPSAGNFSAVATDGGAAKNEEQTKLIDKLKREIESLQKDLEEAEIQIDELEEKNVSLKAEADKLRNDFSTELAKIQERENSQIKQQQKSRKTTIQEIDRFA
jgi:DNA repair exonuclease SbcCD ATPase subunit